MRPPVGPRGKAAFGGFGRQSPSEAGDLHITVQLCDPKQSISFNVALQMAVLCGHQRHEGVNVNPLKSVDPLLLLRYTIFGMQ